MITSIANSTRYCLLLEISSYTHATILFSLFLSMFIYTEWKQQHMVKDLDVFVVIQVIVKYIWIRTLQRKYRVYCMKI